MAVVAEWLRRLTRNQIPSGSVGSNPTDCENIFKGFFFSSLSAFLFQPAEHVSNVGSVVECSPATRAARVRFPDVAIYVFLLHFHNSLVLNILQLLLYQCLYSSVAEHWSCKPGVESSILSGGSFSGVLKIVNLLQL